MNESNDADGCENIFNRGGDGGLRGGGLLFGREHRGAQAGDGVRQHELFAVAGKIFFIDASNGLGERTLRVGLVFGGEIFFRGRRGGGRRQENFLGGTFNGVAGDKFGRRTFLRADSRNKAQRNNFRTLRDNFQRRGLLALNNFHDTTRV